MKAEEKKARELVKMFEDQIRNEVWLQNPLCDSTPHDKIPTIEDISDAAKQCALICVEREYAAVMDMIESLEPSLNHWIYLNAVKRAKDELQQAKQAIERYEQTD